MLIPTASASRYRTSTIATASDQTAGNKDQWTDAIKISTYNTNGYRVGGKTLDDISNMSRNADIFGLQEVYSNEMHDIAAALWNTHEPYVGSGYWGGYQGEFSPIFYNKNRFEAVHGETVRLHGPDYNGIKGPPRIANFLVLKEKKTGAVMLVVNTHWAVHNDEAVRQAGAVIGAKLSSLSKQYPIDNITVMGDFNRHVSAIHGENIIVRGAQYDPNSPPTYEKMHLNIDGILTNAGKADAFYTVSDGGESDHKIVSRTIQFKYKDDPRKAQLLPGNIGAILCEDLCYGGEKWFIGLGSPGPKDTHWNDKISSILVEDATDLRIFDHSPKDPRSGGPEDLQRTITEDISDLGELWNDIISLVKAYKQR